MGRTIVSWATFTYLFNLSGQPAMSFRVGLAFMGVPLRAQVVAYPLDEAHLLALAAENDRALARAPLQPKE